MTVDGVLEPPLTRRTYCVIIGSSWGYRYLPTPIDNPCRNPIKPSGGSSATLMPPPRQPFVRVVVGSSWELPTPQSYLNGLKNTSYSNRFSQPPPLRMVVNLLLSKVVYSWAVSRSSLRLSSNGGQIHSTSLRCVSSLAIQDGVESYLYQTCQVYIGYLQPVWWHC